MNNETIYYAGRDWAEGEIWELCGALLIHNTSVKLESIIGVDGEVAWLVEVQRGVVHASDLGPSPWAALRAAVEGLEKGNNDNAD